MNRTTDSSRQRVATRVLLAGALSLAMALAAAQGQAAKPAAPGPMPSLEGVVNVNTATPEELELLPGVGAARATAIIALRKERGGFQKVDDLLAVKGIGESMLARMRPFVTVKGKTTARKL